MSLFLKGNRHYIDLDKFWRSLKQPYNKKFAFITDAFDRLVITDQDR